MNNVGVVVAAAVFACCARANAVLTPAPTPQVLNFVSAVFGDGMVLQQAPQQAVIWGHSNTPNVRVTTTFAGKVYNTSADERGHWQQRLPPTPASAQSFTLIVKAESGEKATLSNVLFGEVILCSGQSNMVSNTG